jgi:NADH-quinone oxidoreductase subunit K
MFYIFCLFNNFGNEAEIFKARQVVVSIRRLVDIIFDNFFFITSSRLSDLDIFNFFHNLIFINLQVGEECTTLITLGSVLALCNGLFYFTINNKTFLHSLMYAEVCYVGIILKLIDSSSFNGMFDGQIYALIMVTLAAAESALGLGVTIAIFRLYKGVELNLVSIIKA